MYSGDFDSALSGSETGIAIANYVYGNLFPNNDVGAMEIFISILVSMATLRCVPDYYLNETFGSDLYGLVKGYASSERTNEQLDECKNRIYQLLSLQKDQFYPLETLYNCFFARNGPENRRKVYNPNHLLRGSLTIQTDTKLNYFFTDSFNLTIGYEEILSFQTNYENRLVLKEMLKSREVMCRLFSVENFPVLGVPINITDVKLETPKIIVVNMPLFENFDMTEWRASGGKNSISKEIIDVSWATEHSYFERNMYNLFGVLYSRGYDFIYVFHCLNNDNVNCNGKVIDAGKFIVYDSSVNGGKAQVFMHRNDILPLMCTKWGIARICFYLSTSEETVDSHISDVAVPQDLVVESEPLPVDVLLGLGTDGAETDAFECGCDGAYQVVNGCVSDITASVSNVIAEIITERIMVNFI
jgi:hypothetical protein